jgi:HPt (histidine-containing phosphotransfer) domain-containing protein
VRKRGTPSSLIPSADGGVRPRELAGLYEALGKDTGELALLVDDYMRSSAELCAQLRDAVARNDLKSAQRAVHTLASSSGQLGAYRLEAKARELERAAIGGKLPDLSAIETLHREREGAVVKLHEKLSELIGGPG